MIKSIHWYSILALVLLGVMFGCAKQPYSSSNKIYRQQTKKFAKTLRANPGLPFSDSIQQPKHWVGTTNFNLRKPHFVILHHTAQENCSQTLSTFTSSKREVSAHYVICKEGTVYHILNDYLRAWHAGVSRWGQVEDINSVSIGIELDNNGSEPFASAQINALLALLNKLKSMYNIPTGNFIGHADIAPSRKQDPGILFPWELLAKQGFGYWYGDTSKVNVPKDFNGEYALKMIGYDMKNPASARVAFRRHFLSGATNGVFSNAELKVLYLIWQKYY